MASEPDAGPPDTGAAAPDLDLRSGGGQPVRLSALWSERPLVLAFLGNPANPFTGDNAAQLRDAEDAFAALDVEVVPIVPGSPGAAAGFEAAWALPYDVFADADGKARAAYGVTSVATFVVDTTGSIRLARRAANPSDYAPTAPVFEACAAATGRGVPAPPPSPRRDDDDRDDDLAAIRAGVPRASVSPGYACARCGGVEAERATISTAGGWLSRFFNLQYRKFEAVSCTRCGYTELYRRRSGAAVNVLDALSN